MDKVSLNRHVLLNDQGVGFKLLLFQQEIKVSLKWQVGVTSEVLLFRIFPGLEIINFYFVKVYTEGKVVDVIHWDLSVFP